MHLRLHFRRCQEHLQGLWFIPQQTGGCSAGRLWWWTWLVTGKARGGLVYLPNLLSPLQLWPKYPLGEEQGGRGATWFYHKWATREKTRLYGAARWPSGAGSAPEPLPARNVPAHLTVLGRGWIFFAEKSSVSRNQFSSRHSLCSTRN